MPQPSASPHADDGLDGALLARARDARTAAERARAAARFRRADVQLRRIERKTPAPGVTLACSCILAENLQRKNPLRAGLRTEANYTGLGGTTNRRVSGILSGLDMAHVESPPTTTVGDRLRRALLSYPMTVDELIAKTGLGKTTIYRLLKSEDEHFASTQLDTVVALANALTVDGWWLNRGEGEPPQWQRSKPESPRSSTT